jgi:hypothetical protein
VKDYAILPGDKGIAAQPVNYALTKSGYRVYGTITAADLRIPLKWFAHGDTVNTNHALQLQGAEKVWLSSERSPFTSKSMARKWNAEAMFYQEYGVRDVEKVIGTLADAQAMDAQQAQMPPPPIMPQLPPNINDEFMAMFCAMNDTPLAPPQQPGQGGQPGQPAPPPQSPAGNSLTEKYLYYFRQIEAIKGQGKAIGSGSGPGDPETQQELLDAHAGKVKAELGAAATTAKAQAQVAQTKAEAAVQSKLQDASHNLASQQQDAAHAIDLQHQQRTHEQDQREQAIAQTAQQANTNIVNTAAQERLKTQAAAKAANQPGKGTSGNGGKA